MDTKCWLVVFCSSFYMFGLTTVGAQNTSPSSAPTTPRHNLFLYAPTLQWEETPVHSIIRHPGVSLTLGQSSGRRPLRTGIHSEEYFVLWVVSPEWIRNIIALTYPQKPSRSLACTSYLPSA